MNGTLDGYLIKRAKVLASSPSFPLGVPRLDGERSEVKCVTLVSFDI